MVMYSHAFAVYGVGPDPLKAIDPWDSFGVVAVYVFFVISGYLVTASLDYNQSIRVFLKNRALRLFPALTVLTLITVFVIGPLVTSLGLSEYFSAKDTYKYLNNMLIFPMRYEMPGVFIDHPSPKIVNSSLWSLETELKCYLALAALFAVRLLRPRVMLALAIIGTVLHVYFLSAGEVHPTHWFGIKWSNCLTFSKYGALFMGGGACYCYRHYLIGKAWLLALLGVLLLPSFLYAEPISFLLRIPCIICLIYGIAHLPYGHSLKVRRMDISYGIYLYGNIIQQSFWQWGGKHLGFYGFMLACIALSAMAAALSWYLVEKPCLSLKKKSLHADLQEKAVTL